MKESKLEQLAEREISKNNRAKEPAMLVAGAGMGVFIGAGFSGNYKLAIVGGAIGVTAMVARCALDWGNSYLSKRKADYTQDQSVDN